MSLYRQWWVGPVVLSLLLLLNFVLVTPDGDTVAESDGFGDVQGGLIRRAGPTSLYRVESARSAAAQIRWAEGSSSVLRELAACIRAAGNYRIIRPETDSVARASGEFTVRSGDAVGYYRDACLRPIAGRPWLAFSVSYGERPRAWILQLLSAAEDDYDLYRLEPGATDDEAWVRAFAHVPGKLAVFERHLLGVYSRAAADDDVDGPSAGSAGESNPDSGS